MFIGHFAVALAAKRADSKPSLGVYFAAAQLLDLLWPLLLLAGIESVRIEPGITRVTPLDFQYYPYSHSLIAVAGWAAVAGALGFLKFRTLRISLLIAGCVLSHWFLDFVVHRPDLPLHFGDGPLLGLGLWNSVMGTVLVESALFAGALWLYLRQTRARNRSGAWGLFALCAFLVIIWVSSIAGPPPPHVEAIAIAGNLQWVFVGLAFWVDRRRENR